MDAMVRLRSWFVRRLLRYDLARVEEEIEEEFRFHIDMKTTALIDRGMEPEAARALAEECFGDSRALLRSGARDLSSARRRENRRSRREWMGLDLRDGVRRLARHPGFTLLAAGTLALGLSTSTAVFTYVNAYLQPFPGAETGGVYQLFQSSDQVAFGPISYPDFRDLEGAGGRGFEVAGIADARFAASARHERMTEVVFGQAVTGNFFPMLQVEMSLGRGLSPDDDRPGSEPAVVISHEYWARRYGSDPEALGRTLFLNNNPYTIVGVAAPSFLGTVSAFRPHVWMPLEQYKIVYWARSNIETNREGWTISPFLRLGPGLGEKAAGQVLETFTASLDREAPLSERGRKFFLAPATWIQPQVRQAELPTTRIMLVAAAGLLLLACANVANLVLSAGTRRGQEMALRSAMGASRLRLVRQLLAESVLLSALAGALALLAAGPAANRLSSYFARPSVWGMDVPREITVDFRVLAFGFAVAVVSGILTGILPALRASGRNPASQLKGGGRWSSGDSFGVSRRKWGARDLLVSVQIGLSMVLLFLAALVLKTLSTARHVDPGFDTEWTLASYVSTSSMGTPVEEREAFFRDLVVRFEEMPWVRAATVAEQAPLSGHPEADLRSTGFDEPVRATVARVVPGYFEVMGMEIVQGRSLLPEDTVDAAGVVVVNESLAERLMGGESPVGWALSLPGEDGSGAREYEVVGVVRNARQTRFPDEPGPVAYFSLPQGYYRPGNAFLLKVSGDPALAVRRMEEELRSVDSRIAIVNILPYSEVLEGFLYARRMNAELFSVIAVLALILVGAGVFGVMSLLVAGRRREIGIRLAIGAKSLDIVRTVMSRVAVTVLLGLALGAGAAIMARRMVEALLWGVQPTDPLSLGLGMVALCATMAMAVALPLHRALRVNPAASLQAE